MTSSCSSVWEAVYDFIEEAGVGSYQIEQAQKNGMLKTGKHLWVPKSRTWTHIATQLAPVPVSACEYKHMRYMRTQKMHELCDEYGSKLSTRQARLDVLDGLLLSIGWGGLLTPHLETDFCSKPAGLASGLLLFQRLDRSL